MPSSVHSDDLGILIGLAFQAFVHRLDSEMARRGYADAQPSFGYVFRALGEDGSLSTSDLANQLGISPQGAAKIVRAMLAAGYLERRADPDDSRAKLLSLAPRGLNALKTARRAHAKIEAALVERTSPRDVAALRRALRALLDSTSDAPPVLRLA